ncbi:AEC family transporter [Methylocella sp.]|uniref:AEC family transporter n=1 Tax=Methylocella sp. TaxID=1978226 RepID=UPI0037834BC5
MKAELVVAAISPVVLILALGFWAGKRGAFDADQTRGFSRLALSYALPAALFLGMAHFDRALLLRQGPIVVVMALGYSVFFLLGYAALRALRTGALKATLLSYAAASTAAPIYGLPVLNPLFGAEVGAGTVGLCALVTNLSQVCVAIFLLQTAGAPKGEAGAKGGAGEKRGAASTLRAAALGALLNPLVLAPLAGAALALAGVTLSPLVGASLEPLAAGAAGVAIFACGLALAAYPLKLASPTVLATSFVCLVVQPALFFALLKGFGAVGAMAQAAFVASAMPTSTPSVLFAQQYGCEEAELASIMLITTLGLVVALPASLWIAGFL